MLWWLWGYHVVVGFGLLVTSRLFGEWLSYNRASSATNKSEMGDALNW